MRSAGCRYGGGGGARALTDTLHGADVTTIIEQLAHVHLLHASVLAYVLCTRGAQEMFNHMCTGLLVNGWTDVKVY